MALFKVVPSFLTTIYKSNVTCLIPKSFHYLGNSLGSVVSPGGIFDTSFRTIIRCHFPRPSESKRIKRHGWNKRMSNENGKKILMRRILKGRHVYSH
ncbi:uncharacterized protein LOC108738939 [Agrilus planipennis]|uniref:Large ribosomal subunit protein bL34m n=1 Tax=Agrilus planipennis TaxID=224129 RepID=A0A7F5R586_AGRPL|nr:uncharacterized protein LOC108738939 [Agrilus planipennis]